MKKKEGSSNLISSGILQVRIVSSKNYPNKYDLLIALYGCVKRKMMKLKDVL